MHMANKQQVQLQKYVRRQNRVRAKLHGTAKRPRVSVHRSLRHTSAQAINDDAGTTIESVHDKELKATGKPVEQAKAIGLALAEKLKKAGVSTVIFDRGAFKYHGRVQAVAEGLREGGITL